MTNDEYLILQDIDAKHDIVDLLNDNGGCRLTVCPECKVDDFVHVEGCSLLRMEGDE